MRRYTPRPTRPQLRAKRLAEARALAESGLISDAAIDAALTEAMSLIDAPKWARCRNCGWPLRRTPGLFPRSFCTPACHVAWVWARRPPHELRAIAMRANRARLKAHAYDAALKLG